MSTFLTPAPGVKVVPSIEGMPGVETLEGRIGPLLSAEGGACHYIEIPPGAYCDEHAHPTESLIYTVRGEWVLCSGGVRTHMRPGSLFWFGNNVPTGYEVPFDEPALILIFKTNPRESDAAFLEYLEGMAARLEADHAAGTPFRFDDLPEDHPAKVFARSLGR